MDVRVRTRSPTDLLAFPEIHHYLAAFGNFPGQQQALVDILIKGQPAHGTSPLQNLK